MAILSLFYITTDPNYSKQQWPTPRIELNNTNKAAKKPK